MARPGDHNSVNLATAVYGTITVGALLAAESARHETYAETVGAVVLAMLLYWLAHAYSEYASWRVENRKPLTFPGFARFLVSEVPMLGGAAVSLVAVLVAWALRAALTDALTAAVWTSAAMIAILEIAAGVRAHGSRRQLAAQIVMGVALGLLVEALRILLH